MEARAKHTATFLNILTENWGRVVSGRPWGGSDETQQSQDSGFVSQMVLEVSCLICTPSSILCVKYDAYKRPFQYHKGSTN